MDVDGEGSPFDLAQKRATSFGSAGMVFCESSPGFEVLDASWQREAGSHASPPCEGVLAVFNRGDRRLWHWKCDHCHDYFEPLFDHLVWTEQEDDIATAESTQMSCPNCGGLHGPEDKYRLNLGGIWVPEGQHVETIDDEPVLVGEPRRSDIASYWLAGPAAAFQKWDGMVMKYRQAMEEFENNGSEEALKTTTNVDQCKPFLSMYKATQRSAAELESRAGPSEKKIVPDGVRTLVTSIDVNGSWFSVQVTGIGVSVNTSNDGLLTDTTYVSRQTELETTANPPYSTQAHTAKTGTHSIRSLTLATSAKRAQTAPRSGWKTESRFATPAVRKVLRNAATPTGVSNESSATPPASFC